MSKRTPGKWELLTDFSVWSPSENALVCACHSGDRRLRDTREISQEEAHANARLIAAAPELLRALIFLVNAHEHPAASSGRRGVLEHVPVALDHARATIARATGAAEDID